MEATELQYWVAFSRFPKFGVMRVKKLLAAFPTLAEAWNASLQELLHAGIDEETAKDFVARRGEINPGEELERTMKEGISLVTVRDEAYPALLAEISSPPPLLFVRGTLPVDAAAVAVVGTRTCTPYGRQVAQELGRELGAAGVLVVSGLAVGIDTEAHKACLDAGGKTVAVLGSGLDKESMYPKQNWKLAERIATEGGAVISEFPLGTPSLPHHFPQRNRIIAGLSLGTVVVEANEESGALITARHALEENREVFAVPGSMYAPKSKGPNALLKMGARVVTGAQDILDALDLRQVAQEIEAKAILPDTKEEAALIPHLSREPIHIDDLITRSGLDTAVVSGTLTLMEMKGKVRCIGGAQYVLAR